jgi:hypothetical protein
MRHFCFKEGLLRQAWLGCMERKIPSANWLMGVIRYVEKEGMEPFFQYADY